MTTGSEFLRARAQEIAPGRAVPDLHHAMVHLLKFMTGLDERMVEGAIVSEAERDKLYDEALSLATETFERLLDVEPHLALYFLEPPFYLRPKRLDLERWLAIAQARYG